MTWQAAFIVLCSLALGCRADRTIQASLEPNSAVEKRAQDNKLALPVLPRPWPSFRGINASGVADGEHPPLTWDAEKGINIRWKTSIPGLGHSCPIIWGDRVFLTTAISGNPNDGLRPGHYGDVDSVQDASVHTWKIYCLDKGSGQILWEHRPHAGVPRVKRHLKGTHANPTPATDGKHIVASFGSEGIVCCYDFNGTLLWKIDLGALDSGHFQDPSYQWGFASSPIIYRNLVILQCDLSKNSFIAAYDLASGKEIWNMPRVEVPSWGTPTIFEGFTRDELVTNASGFVRGYDPLTGKELWRLEHGADITVPTPIGGDGLIFIMSGKGSVHPIFAVRPGATDDISLRDNARSNEFIAWSQPREGPYIPTPIVYGGYLYTCDTRTNIVACYEANTGKQVYRERLGGKGTYTASSVAADGRLYFTSEESGVHVVKAGPTFEILAVNLMGDICMATPAISGGMIFIRTQHFMFGIGEEEVSN